MLDMQKRKTTTEQPNPSIKTINSQIPLYINTHDHIDYGGDDCEHSLNLSKVQTEAERIEKRFMYRGD